ncbi:serine hydrolase domain-containing protein [Rhizobium leguminosarum]|uniref:serine hydrolase domain-containing protein n=1 Tax=Rhizobium leguminosarum TaxID=384 RepID=UPI001C9024E3|nr:serine hydrolase domain-containing protein [Rhizobium leguminosarum]MBY2989335.1 beta-lactamase family protein [Rhizobium leguminosarum]
MRLEKLLDAVLDDAISREKIVGAVLLVSKNGELIYERACGMSDRENNIPMQVDAIFRLSSLTKPVIAAAILAMEKRGALSLDAAARDFLPEFLPQLPDGERPNITVRNLLTHTSGLSMALDGAADDDGEVDDPIGRYGRCVLDFRPGTGWRYSRAHDVLGAILAAVVGEPIAEAVANSITLPLGMHDTAFSVVDPSRLTTAYADGGERPIRMNDHHQLPNPWGGITVFNPARILDAHAYPSGSDGMAGTANDYLKLLECLRTGREPLDPHQAAAALSDQIPQLAYSTSPGWKFSFIGARLEAPEKVGTFAPPGLACWGGVYGHSWSIDPINAISVVSMSNTALEGSDGDFPLAIRSAIYSTL